MFKIGNPKKNFEFYIKNRFLILPKTKIKIDVITYFLTKANDIAMEIGWFLGFRNKSTGYIITFLFFYQNLDYYDLENDINFISRY